MAKKSLEAASEQKEERNTEREEEVEERRGGTFVFYARPERGILSQEKKRGKKRKPTSRRKKKGGEGVVVAYPSLAFSEMTAAAVRSRRPVVKGRFDKKNEQYAPFWRAGYCLMSSLYCYYRMYNRTGIPKRFRYLEQAP